MMAIRAAASKSKNKTPRESSLTISTDSEVSNQDIENGETPSKPFETFPNEANKKFMALLSCLAYSFCSCSMVLSNKALASSFGADIDIMMVSFQNLVAICLVEGLRHSRYIESYSLNVATAMKWLPVNIFFVMMLFTGFMSLKTNNVPMVTVFKNLTNIIIVAGDWYFHKEKVTVLILASFGWMLVGAVMAAWTDLEFQLVGYFWMAANCLSTACYVLYMRHATQNIRLSRWAMVFYNNFLSLPTMMFMAFLKGEMGIFFSKQELWTWPFVFTNLYTGVVGFSLNLASLWCVGSTSATTYAIIGSVNKIPVAFLGYFLFSSPITAQGAIYIAMSMFGGFLYSYAKFKLKNKEAVAPEVSESKSECPKK